MSSRKFIGLLFLSMLTAGGLTLAFMVIQRRGGKGMMGQRTEAARDVYYASTDGRGAKGPYWDFTEVAAASMPAVVHIKADISITSAPSSDIFGRVAPGDTEFGTAIGSGVIVGADGYIVTNNHLIADARELIITTYDHREFRARVIGNDARTDLALLKVDATGLPVLKPGNSDELKVGEFVLAIGNPYNFTWTATQGIVSGKDRKIGITGTNGIEHFIQTDAAINMGNSGGALVNTKGELVGIVDAMSSTTGAYEGYGFVIPIGLVRKVIGGLKK
jgi:S1-C subfamily serine protease